MSWSLRGALILASLLGCATAIAAQGSKTTEPAKKEPAKTRPALDKMKFPAGIVVVICDDIREALGLAPRGVLITPEEYQALLDLKQPPRTDKKLASWCTLAGKLEGSDLTLRAEFGFSTEQPRTTVILGLKGAHLADKGEIDSQVPVLDFGDEGFLVRVEKAGDHRLTLNLRVPVEAKKAAGAERGFELELPGTVVTTFDLDLPARVKEIRANDRAEKPTTAGRWHFPLGTAKKLTVSWKEPVTLPGIGPLPTVEGRLDVRLNETHVLVTADLDLEDLRGQLREWQLLLPPGASAQVAKAPGGLSYELLPPEGANPHHVLKVSEPNNERWQVSVQVRYPRPSPGNRVPIGPFFVEGAYRQQGTILVHVPPETLHGQRLVYHKGDVYQKDLPKTRPAEDLEAIFQYWALAGKNARGGLKVPLELEIKSEKGQVETRSEHSLKLRSTGDAWLLELTSRLHGKSLLAGADSLDVQLPMPRPRGVAALAFVTMGTYPAAVPWAALLEAHASPALRGQAGEYQVHDESGKALDLTPLDGSGRARITWAHSLDSKPFTAVLTSRFQVPRSQRHLRVELPRPLGTLDREARISIQADEQIELLVGPPGAEEPVPDRHSYQVTAEQSPAHLDLGWRFYRRDLPAEAVVDVLVHERTAQVSQRLTFPAPERTEAAGAMATGQIRLLLPKGVRPRVLAGGQLNKQPEQDSAWIVPERGLAEKQELVLQYDLVPSSSRRGERLLNVPLIWPAGVTSKAAKVRAWGHPGVRVSVADGPLVESVWKDRGLEAVPGRPGLPALVVMAHGPDVPLTLRLEQSATSALAALLCDRALIRVELDEEGGQLYRARYRIQKAIADHVEIELPDTVQGLSVKIGNDSVQWQAPAWNVARIPLQPDLYTQPVVLDVEYKLAPSFFEGKSAWRSSLHPPVFREAVKIGQTRWEVALPPGQTGVVVGRNLNLDYRWSWQGGLLAPRPALSGSELETWLTDKSAPDTRDVTLTFERVSAVPPQLYHLRRELWLGLCSGTLLLVALGLALLPMPRPVFWGLVAALSLGLLTLGLFWPALLPVLAFGGEIGVAVLALVLGAHWLLHERYRRQVTFMPGFTRTTRSSQSRGSSNRRPQEPSTVDAPPPASALSPTSSAPRQG